MAKGNQPNSGFKRNRSVKRGWASAPVGRGEGSNERAYVSQPKLDSAAFGHCTPKGDYVPKQERTTFYLSDHVEEARRVLSSEECILNRSDLGGKPFVDSNQISYCYLGERLENGDISYSVCFQVVDGPFVYGSRLMIDEHPRKFAEVFGAYFQERDFELVGGEKIDPLPFKTSLPGSLVDNFDPKRGDYYPK